MISFFRYKKNGRNNSGRITVRHRGAGFSFCSPNFANLDYDNKVSSFSLKSFNFNTDTSVNAFVSPYSFTNKVSSKKFYNIYFSRFNANQDSQKFIFECSIGQFLYDVELIPSRGAKICRSFGSYCQLLRKRGSYATVRFPSGEIRKLSVFCSAKVWSSKFQYSKLDFSFNKNPHKAGFSRNLGIRPHVRGCAINPVDHPHGGRTGESRPSVSPWAQLTKGYRTRLKPINRKFVFLSVQDMKNRSAGSSSAK